MDKLYCETRGEKPIDWNLFLDRALRFETTMDENAAAEGMAGMWPTCACGNQCAIIPRGLDGSPRDDGLRELGSCFYLAIGDRNWRRASVVLADIEARSAVLIAEELAKLNREAVSA